MKQLNRCPVSPTNFKRNLLRKTLPLLVISFALILGSAGIASAQSINGNLFAATINPTTVELESTYSLERRVLDLVNVRRLENGQQPLVWVEAEANAARSHSQNMAENNYLSHADLVGVRMVGRAKIFGFNNWTSIGENIGWVSGKGDLAARVVESWMNSEGHRKNILNRKYCESGIGIALAKDGKYYFTQVFVRRN